jgi:hypothetical protein
MSRLVGQPVPVVTTPEGTPALVGGLEVIGVSVMHKEWIGALEGKGEIEVWRIETNRGAVELHLDIATRTWILAREED